MKPEHRIAHVEQGALVSLLGLLCLTMVKGSAGIATGSKALLADACHTAADCASSLSSYMGYRRSARPASRRKPESATVVVLSALLFVAGLEMGISSVRSVVNGVEQPPGVEAVAVIAAAIAAREGLVRYKRRQDAAHGIRQDRSDNRSDIFASLTALVGATGAMAGEWLDEPVLYVLDPAAGLVVSVFVLRMGFRLAQSRQGASERSVLDEMNADTLLETVQQVNGVLAIDEVRAREQGHYVVLDLTIRVNPRISVTDGNDIAQCVKRRLMKRYLHVTDACVQVLPYDPGYPYKSNHLDEEVPAMLQ